MASVLVGKLDTQQFKWIVEIRKQGDLEPASSNVVETVFRIEEVEESHLANAAKASTSLAKPTDGRDFSVAFLNLSDPASGTCPALTLP